MAHGTTNTAIERHVQMDKPDAQKVAQRLMKRVQQRKSNVNMKALKKQ